MREPVRRYFDDQQGRTCWIQKMGSVDCDTIYWIGGPGHEMGLFSAEYSSEAAFTRDELLRELANHDHALGAWH